MQEIASAPATYALILANLIFTLIGFAVPRFFHANKLSVGDIVQGGQIQRVVTSGFLHANGGHLLVNMLTLYFFGRWLEHPEFLGLIGFLIVYFTALVAGSVWAIIENLRQPDYAAVGASGAVSGVVISFCLFQPFAMLYVFMLIPVPAILFAVLYIAYSAASTGNANSRIGHEAHLGGAIAGLLVTMALSPGIVSEVLQQVPALLGV